ncbi:MAG TPA: iron-sulfur cluster assembly scaffold protein [Pirellulaceae bacterium]|nr:iron-sulfur cluster assembly scaffold protein [Pirellulaceae bacterium]
MSRPSSKVMDHVTSPRNAGEMASPDGVGKVSLDGNAPYVTIYIKIADDRIERATFQTFGCGYSIATCSVLTELVAGSLLSEALKLSPESLLECLDGVPPEKEFCAGMAVDALHAAVSHASSKPPYNSPAD